MATQNENKVSFFEVLEKFRNGQGIELPLKKWNALELQFILDGVILQLDLLDSKKYEIAEYEIQKQFIKFFYGLLECTSLKIKESDIIIENLDFEFEQYVLDNSITARKLYEMIDNIIKKRELGVIEMLTEQFKTLPSVDEIKELEEGLNGIFKDKSEGELKMIESILEYNDPNMKAIKDIISAPVEKLEIKETDNNADNITKGEKV